MLDIKPYLAESGPRGISASRCGRIPTARLDLAPVLCTLAREATALPFAAADMTALPFRSVSLAGVVCPYAVIGDAGRAGPTESSPGAACRRACPHRLPHQRHRGGT